MYSACSLEDNSQIIDFKSILHIFYYRTFLILFLLLLLQLKILREVSNSHKMSLVSANIDKVDLIINLYFSEG